MRELVRETIGERERDMATATAMTREIATATPMTREMATATPMTREMATVSPKHPPSRRSGSPPALQFAHSQKE